MKIDSKIIDEIKSLKTPLIIAVSGFGGSGKSTVAKELGNKLNTSVVGVDSFQKKGIFNTKYSMWEIMDFSRLEKEVLQPFVYKQDIIRYGNFNGKTEVISETIELPNNGMIIVEGVGLFRPDLMKYFAYKIWIDCPIEKAITRGKKRDREEYHNPTDELWDGIWKENDLEYFEEFKPKSSADIIVDNN